jgi:hypothetical protein
VTVESDVPLVGETGPPLAPLLLIVALLLLLLPPVPLPAAAAAALCDAAAATAAAAPLAVLASISRCSAAAVCQTLTCNCKVHSLMLAVDANLAREVYTQ